MKQHLRIPSRESPVENDRAYNLSQLIIDKGLSRKNFRSRTRQSLVELDKSKVWRLRLHQSREINSGQLQKLNFREAYHCCIVDGIARLLLWHRFRKRAANRIATHRFKLTANTS